MYKWLISGLILVSLVTGYMIIRFGMNVKLTPIIKPSNFEAPEKFARYIYRQLYSKIKYEDVFVFAQQGQNPYFDQLLESYLRIITAETGKVVSLYSDRDFLNYSSSMASVKFQKLDISKPDDFFQEMSRDLENHPVVILLSSNNIFETNKDSFFNRLELFFKKDFLTFSFWDISNVSKDIELKPCPYEKNFNNWIQCVFENKSRQIEISEKVDRTKPVGILDRVTETDYFLYLKK